MISYKLEGITEVVKMLTDKSLMPEKELDLAVKESTEPLILAIKQNYLSKGHKITGNLINSIQAFKRQRKNDTWFTYYVGPKYGVGGGNHAHFLEYGVKANSYPVKGQGMSIRGRKYGKYQTSGGFRIQPTGIIRKSKDEKEQQVLKDLEKGIVLAIVTRAKKKGFTIS